jgi:hypothetical protein
MILSGRWGYGKTLVPLFKSPMGEGFGWVLFGKIWRGLISFEFRKINQRLPTLLDFSATGR